MTDPDTLVARQKLLANSLIAGWPALEIPAISVLGAAAAVGNATQENNCKSVTLGTKDHGSDGLFQWRLDRLTSMQVFGVKNFGHWDSIEAQAAFFSFECKGWYKSLWSDLVDGKKSLDTLTANICAQYERPAAASAALDARIKYATDFLAIWKPEHVVPTPVPTPTPTPTLLGVSLMDPAIINALAPIVEALAAGLFRALITQLSHTSGTGGVVAPGTVTPFAPLPAINLGSLASELAPLLKSQLESTLPNLIAMELARISPTTAVGTKP